MTVYAKIENNKLITAYNGYNGVIGMADSPELCEANGFTAYTEEQISGYFAGTHQIIDGVLTDISQTADYLAKIKKQEIQTAKSTRDTAYDNITNSVILDQLAIINLDLELANATITQAEYDAQKLIYNNRIKAKATLFANVTSNFYTTTGLTAPTITV